MGKCWKIWPIVVHLKEAVPKSWHSSLFTAFIEHNVLWLIKICIFGYKHWSIHRELLHLRDENEAQENLSETLLMKVNLLLWSKSIRLYSLSRLEEWTFSLSHTNSVREIFREVGSIIEAKNSLENIRKGLYNPYTLLSSKSIFYPICQQSAG